MNPEKHQTHKYNGLAGLEDFVKNNTDYFEEKYSDPESTQIETWNEFLSFLDEGAGPIHTGEYARHLQSEMSDETRMNLIGSWNEAQTGDVEGMYRVIQLPINGSESKPPIKVKFFENGRVTFTWGPEL
jgi:hypothetical protein